MDKTSPSLIHVKRKYEKDVLWGASLDIIHGEQRTWYRLLLCLLNLSSLFLLSFFIYPEYFSKLGMYLFLHVFENLSPPFKFPLIPTHLVSWGKSPLFLHPYCSSNTWRSQILLFATATTAGNTSCGILRKIIIIIIIKIGVLERILTENHFKKESNIFRWPVLLQESQLFHLNEYFPFKINLHFKKNRIVLLPRNQIKLSSLFITPVMLVNGKFKNRQAPKNNLSGL